MRLMFEVRSARERPSGAGLFACGESDAFGGVSSIRRASADGPIGFLVKYNFTRSFILYAVRLRLARMRFVVKH